MSKPTPFHRRRGLRTALLVLLATLPVAGTTRGAPHDDPDPCFHAALLALESCKREAASDYWLARGNCTQLSTYHERLTCKLDALLEYFDAVDECRDRRSARFQLCYALGGGAYVPEIDPDDFVSLIDNPWLPLHPGTTWIYEKDADGEIEHTEVTVTDDTIEILGVECTVVRDTVSVDGEIQEDTYDWFAQDSAGNVWYFGELSFGYEDGEIASLEGSWKAGVDHAQPGIVMPANPQVGDIYRQEYKLREAEDVFLMLDLDATATVPYGGTHTGCLETEDYTPIQPDVVEHKFYAPGIGLVLELDPETGERTELIDIVMN